MAKNKTEPAHYAALAIQPKDVVIAWRLCFWLGNCLKYVCRRGTKAGESELDDLKKAKWYLDERIKQLEAEAQTNG